MDNQKCKMYKYSVKLQFLPRDAMLSAVYAVVVCLSVCLSVCVSVTHRYCIKMAKRRITRITPHDSPMTLVFRHQSSRRYNTKTVQDRRIVSIKVEYEVVCALSNDYVSDALG